MTHPGISIILLTLNGGPTLAATLNAIAAQSLECDGQPLPTPEIVAIDSGSTDGTLDLLRQSGITPHSIPPEDFGHGSTRNLGASLADGAWLVYLSQDAVPASRFWLARLTRHLGDPGVAAAFGRQLPPAGLGPIETFFLENTYPPRGFTHAPTGPGASRASIRRIFFSNVNAAIQRAALRQCPFPTDVLMSEDQAFAQAASRAGYSLVYDPDAAVVHGHRYSLSQLFRRNFDSGYSLREIAGDGWGAVARLGLAYVWAELRYLAHARQWAYIPYALLYELIKSAGFAAGRGGYRLPIALRRRLSLHRAYWLTHNE
jgi:rhamnosyltransferase